MEVNFKVEYQHSRQEVADAFNKTIHTLYMQPKLYKQKGGRKGILNTNQQIPFGVFASRIIRNTPREFWEFFLDDDNFRQCDIVKKVERDKKARNG